MTPPIPIEQKECSGEINLKLSFLHSHKSNFLQTEFFETPASKENREDFQINTLQNLRPDGTKHIYR